VIFQPGKEVSGDLVGQDGVFGQFGLRPDALDVVEDLFDRVDGFSAVNHGRLQRNNNNFAVHLKKINPIKYYRFTSKSLKVLEIFVDNLIFDFFLHQIPESVFFEFVW
jgi:hypothetical protein